MFWLTETFRDEDLEAIFSKMSCRTAEMNKENCQWIIRKVKAAEYKKRLEIPEQVRRFIMTRFGKPIMLLLYESREGFLVYHFYEVLGVCQRYLLTVIDQENLFLLPNSEDWKFRTC